MNENINPSTSQNSPLPVMKTPTPVEQAEAGKIHSMPRTSAFSKIISNIPLLIGVIVTIFLLLFALYAYSKK